MTIQEIYERYRNSSGICTDTRKLEPNCMFIALRGDNFDGNTYAQQALERGASYAVVDDKKVASKDERMILVEDGLGALQELSRHHRLQFDVPILAITGSNGKTTTKELCKDVLAKKYRVHSTKGNLNNHIGVPLTLLSISEDTEFAIVEMGANHQGEIAELCEIALPTHGLITNIGYAHIEGFGGLEGIKKGKSELYRYLDKNKGLAFVNSDEKYLLSELLPESTAHVCYGQQPIPKTEGERYEVGMVQAEPTVNYRFFADDRWHNGTSQLFGKYNFANIATAVATGLEFGVNANDILAAIESYVPNMNRSQLMQVGNIQLILDAYNANPSSMENALMSLAQRESGLPKIAVLGGMNELGKESKAKHQELINLAAELPIQNTICIGSLFDKLNFPEGVIHLSERKKLEEWWEQLKEKDDSCILLVKGSRSYKLEAIFSHIG